MTDLNPHTPVMGANITDTITDDAVHAVNESKMSFADLGLASPLLAALDDAGYRTPTPIQVQAIPLALAGHDLMMSAQTGSGKTAAFVLPILHKLADTKRMTNKDVDETQNFSQKSHKKHQKPTPKALILTPTRELAMQVHDSVRRYGSALKGVFGVPLVGGSAYGGQIRALHKGVHIIVATPGRLIDHMTAGRVDLSALELLVLDEADRMLDMGFSDAIDEILANAPSARQTLMSSATWDGAVGEIARSHTQSPKEISIAVKTAHIDESVYYCDDFGHKNRLLDELITKQDVGQAVIFTATKKSSERLATDLMDKGHKARYLHGDLPQAKRNRIIQDVKSGKCRLLIATDVAARGIDIAGISHVINYDLPRQVEDYVHRIGRSGRAGRNGVAINLCSLDDKSKLEDIKRYLKRDITTKTMTGLESKKAHLFERPKTTRHTKTRTDKKRGQQKGDSHAQGRVFGERAMSGQRGYGKARHERRLTEQGDAQTPLTKPMTKSSVNQSRTDKSFSDKVVSDRSCSEKAFLIQSGKVAKFSKSKEPSRFTEHNSVKASKHGHKPMRAHGNRHAKAYAERVQVSEQKGFAPPKLARPANSRDQQARPKSNARFDRRGYYGAHKNASHVG